MKCMTFKWLTGGLRITSRDLFHSNFKKKKTTHCTGGLILPTQFYMGFKKFAKPFL